jgi:alanine dehydrogenase
MLQDDAYRLAGATIVDAKEAFAQDIVLKVRPPELAEAQNLQDGNRSAVNWLKMP